MRGISRCLVSRIAESLRLVAFRPRDETNGHGALGEQTNVTQQEVR